MKLNNLIKRLGEFEPDGHPVLSLYLDARSNEIGREDYPIWLKKNLSQTENEIADRDRYRDVIDRIDAYIEDKVDPEANGIAIFAGLGDGGLFETVQLAVPFEENQLHVLGRPHIFPLFRTVWLNPKFAVMWSDTNKADIYVFGGENRIISGADIDRRVESIQNTVTNRSEVGGWSQARYQRHVENYHLRHAKEVVAELHEVVTAEQIQSVVLCGDEQRIMPVLRPQLPKALDEKVVGVLNLSQYSSQGEIREKALQVLNSEKSVKDIETANKALDAARAEEGLGTIGLEATLWALSNGQVQELVIGENLDTIERDPGQANLLLNKYGYSGGIPTEASSAELAAQMADMIVMRALQTDAQITVVTDPTVLDEAEGIAAVLRYQFNVSVGAR